MDLGIVIVSFNVRELLAACLNSVVASLALSQLDARIIVLDNASADGSAAMVREQFPGVQLIASQRNLGFAAANNVGMCDLIPNSESRISKFQVPRHVLLLNPDTEVWGEALAVLVHFLDEHPDVGAVGARLLYPDGRLQHGAFHFPGVVQTFFDFFPTHRWLTDSWLNGRYSQAAYANGPFPIDHPLGACLMVRAEAIRQIGLMDEQFFMYCEEIDWCLRLKRAGWQIYCVPQAEVVHHVARSTRQFREAMFVALWRSRLRLYAKHSSPARQWAIRQVIRLGVEREIRRASTDDRLSPAERDARLKSYHEVLTMLRC
jgi:N-acetylglucosaminyl-diphospho-decaprenol L-rhamnosyltransferase